MSKGQRKTHRHGKGRRHRPTAGNHGVIQWLRIGAVAAGVGGLAPYDASEAV